MSMTTVGITAIVLPSTNKDVAKLLSGDGLALVMKQLCGAVIFKGDVRAHKPTTSRPKAP